MSAIKTTIPDNISEEYYQISPEILISFPKYRPPLDLFEFKENISRLQPYIRKGERLSNTQIDEVNALCETGLLFVSRSDHPVYSKHICKQLDLVLVDKNLMEAEISDIFVQAFHLRLEQFYDQPVKVVFDLLYKDIMVLTEHLTSDWFRIKSLTKRLVTEHTLVNHSVNTAIMGLWMFLKGRNGEFKRRELDKLALSLFLHDLGMCKIPHFIRSKAVPLTPDERAKIAAHPSIGIKIAQKLGLDFDEMKMCIFEHHERLDGSGYPRKVSGDEITRVGRICALADSFCAMITERPYASALTPQDAALALYKDTGRYDERYATLLHTAYVTKEL